VGTKQAQALFPVVRDLGPETLPLQGVGDGLGEGSFVLDEEDERTVR
jgi:hypothetical protein